MGDKIVNTLKHYDSMVNELGAYPAKHIINSLTMIAEDLTIAKHLAPFLVKKLALAGPQYKLPILYLMDSIIKNVGGPYAYLFGQTLGSVYVDSVRVVNPTDLNRFVHVLKTWESSRLFPPNVLGLMRGAADGALRVAQPSDQPTSFSRVPQANPSRSSRPHEDTQLEVRMRRLLTQLQTEDGIHPARQLSLEEVRTQNPDLYTNLKMTCQSEMTATAPTPVLGHRPVHSRSSEPILSHPSRRNEPRMHAHHTHNGGLLPIPQPRQAPISRSDIRRSPPRAAPRQDNTRHSAPSGRDVMNLLKKINAMSSNPHQTSHRNTTLKCSDIQVNKKRIDANVYLLYGALPHVCTSSGLRFKDETKLSEHMDFLFKYNRALRERTKGGISRSWYPNEEQWTTDFCTVSNSKEETSAGFVQTTEAPEIDKEALNAARVPVDASITKCRICGESFTKCWDEEEEEWMYQNAVIGSIQTDILKQTIFHKYCYDSAVTSSKSRAILPSQLAPGSPMIMKRPYEAIPENHDSEQENNKRLKNSEATEPDSHVL